jgi:methyl-accepting chemotaxis protein
VQYATNEQTTGSKQITGAVESVTTQAAQIARSTSEQKQGAGQISTAVASIQKITMDSVDLSIEIDIAMQALRQRADELRTALGKFTL